MWREWKERKSQQDLPFIYDKFYLFFNIIVVYVKCFLWALGLFSQLCYCLFDCQYWNLFVYFLGLLSLVSELLRIGICMLRFGSNPQLKHSCFAELALSGGTEPRKKFSRVKKIKLHMVSERLFLGHPSKEAKGINANVCFKIWEKICYFRWKFRLASQGAGCRLVPASKNRCEPASFRVRARLDAIPTRNQYTLYLSHATAAIWCGIVRKPFTAFHWIIITF